MNRSDTSCGSPVGDYPAPGGQRWGFKVTSFEPEIVSYLIYCINKGLSIVTIEASDHLYLSTIREDRCDQGNALMRGKGMGNQLFPSWNVTVHEKVVKLTNGQLLESTRN
jgi:hypothetical protein